MIPVVDLVAGPGGLREGFSAAKSPSGVPLFRIVLSIEKDRTAAETLRLRSFFRQFPDSGKPREYYEQVRAGRIAWSDLAAKYPREHAAAERDVWQAELGGSGFPPAEVDRRIEAALLGQNKGDWVLIGGPPCQAYSLVGRTRLKAESEWHFARDPRHLLYREYLRIIAVHQPPVFVMENVKGILSSKKSGKLIIDRILSDLAEPSKALKGPRQSLQAPTDCTPSPNTMAVQNSNGRIGLIRRPV